MHIASYYVDSEEIQYDHLPTKADKAYCQIAVAQKLYNKHSVLVKAAGIEPEFFIDHVPSKMNYDDSD